MYYFELINDTSVLNITYIDTDKSLIIPVLKRSQELYQKYSISKEKERFGVELIII